MSRIEDIKDRCQTTQMVFSPVSRALETVLRQDIPYLLSQIESLMDQLQEANNQLEINLQSNYICAVRHYDKYGSRYTFALSSQWNELEFDSFDDYQEFQMQLVYLLGAAKEKWKKRNEQLLPKVAEKGDGGNS